jgi:NTP pyrophosphatase (non-canonical NTP hydrolase)
VAKHFNDLTPAQAERLALLLEEMGEAQQIIGKILRHGYESYNPNHPDGTNRMLLENELADVLAAIKMMENAEDIQQDVLTMRCVQKQQKVRRYLHHQPAKLLAKLSVATDEGNKHG